MDDIIQRSRYPRHSVNYRGRKKNTRANPTISEIVIRQVFISILILLVIVIVKNIDSSVTKYLSKKIQEAIFYNIEIKEIYQDIKGRFSNGKEAEKTNQDEAGFDEEAVQVTGGISAIDSVNVEGLDRDYCIGEEFIAPLNGVLGTEFGNRLHPMKNIAEFHSGIDIGIENTGMVKAALSGVVLESDSDPLYGKYIKLWHKPGLETVYAHCSSLMVEKGQKVGQGDIIAQINQTGTTVGTHLHFEIWEDGQPVNPADYIRFIKVEE
ncbi:MAG: M23 family metallopeptidase [Acetivibrionales bacterium]|jgi:murein DD-endopeptidase MepM/ murein hydrolase activator NlpD